MRVGPNQKYHKNKNAVFKPEAIFVNRIGDQRNERKENEGDKLRPDAGKGINKNKKQTACEQGQKPRAGKMAKDKSRDRDQAKG